MLIFLEWVNWAFQIFEPAIHFSMFFKQKKWAEEKTHFIIVALCIICLCVQWDHFEKVKWLGNLQDVLSSLPYSVLLPGEDVEDIAHGSHRSSWPEEAF